MQKSGYFARSAAANTADLALIRAMAHVAVECALRGEGGVVGHDEEQGGELRAIEFPRIKGGKPFDIATPWFTDMLTRHRPAAGDAGTCRLPRARPPAHCALTWTTVPDLDRPRPEPVEGQRTRALRVTATTAP